MIHATEILSRFIAGLRYEDLPDDVIATTKMYIVDYYAAAFAGIQVNGKFNRAVEEVLFDMGGKEEATVLCSDTHLPVMNAAYLNAVYAHGADMDDGNRKAMGHVAAHVMSTVFALAETMEVSGKELFVAMNVGYEVYNRIGAAVQPGLVRRGFHSTGTAGAVACGAAAAKLMKLSEHQIYNAISLAAIQASGLMIITESGQSCKPINPANAARVGIMAAKLAAKGIESSAYPLESPKGWFHAMSDNVDETAITDGLGEVFTICESYLKPYPSCRHTHPGIEAALWIREQWRKRFGEICVEEVDAIEVHIYQNAIRVAGQITLPQTEEEAKFSIHYSLAVALLTGHFDLEDLPTENVTPAVKALVDKITFVEDPAMENAKAGIRGSRVEMRLKDGTTLEKQVDIPKGDAANPFTWEELKAKLAACSNGVIDEKQQATLMDTVNTLDEIHRFETINLYKERT